MLRTVFTWMGWLALAVVVFAIMVIWNWDPVAFLTYVFDRGSDMLLQWEWFRKLVGAPA